MNAEIPSPLALDERTFHQFLVICKSDLRRISRHTRGEASLEDVQAEAWLMAVKMNTSDGSLDLLNAAHRSRLLSHLYQHLVRYTETNVRYAVRLDHAPGGEDDSAHPLAYLLAAPAQSDPVLALMAAEEEEARCGRVGAGVHQSLAAAYLHLLTRLDNDMKVLAGHLLISLSYCYRCAHARLLANHQLALPAAAMAHGRDFVPGAWRSFRLERSWMQGSLDFGAERQLF